MRLARARAALELGDPEAAREIAAEMLPADPWEWRALWVDGLAAMLQRDWDTAKASFNAVYQQVPGELAPKLALAVACEKGGLPAVAEGLYLTCAATDAAYVAPAAFGVARVRAERGDAVGRGGRARPGAEVEPRLPREPPAARRGAARLGGCARPARARPGDALDRVGVDGPRHPGPLHRADPRAGARRRHPAAAAGGAGADGTIGSHDAATEPGLREGIERAYRLLARDASDLAERIELVNRANAVRAWTLT